MFLLIESGEVYDPEPRGRSSVLIANDRIERIGRIDRRGLDALGGCSSSSRKGKLEAGKDADVIVLDRSTLEIRHAIARGRRMVSDGAPVVREKFLEKSSRSIDLVGDKFEGSR